MAISITEDAVLDAVRAFILAATGITPKNVLSGPLNRVAMPKGDFVLITPNVQASLATNTTQYTATTRLVTRSTDWSAQIDCYGPNAGDVAQTIGALFRDPYGCDQLAPNGLAPLYATDAQQLPIVNGENQQEKRWTLALHVAYKPVVTVPQDSASTLRIDFTEVDGKYPPI